MLILKGYLLRFSGSGLSSPFSSSRQCESSSDSYSPRQGGFSLPFVHVEIAIRARTLRTVDQEAHLRNHSIYYRLFFLLRSIDSRNDGALYI